MADPAQKFDPVIHQPTRLSIVAALSAARGVSFTYLRDQLKLTDGNLSRHLEVLQKAGYITIDKKFSAKKPQTWIALTPAGKQAFTQEITSLQALIDTTKAGE